jgi:hypothetical protein
MTKEIEQILVNTTCPICNRIISEVWIAKLDSVIGLRYAYICGECENLLKLTKDKITNISNNPAFLFTSTYTSEKTSV